ncbi:MAG: NUDIX domain-containing protein [Isosphaeraceae bacterium]
MPEDHFPQPYGPWVINKRSIIYHDPWLKVTRDDVTRPDGTPGTYCISHMKPGVCVLALDCHGNCHLTEEFHYAVGRVTIECVSGGIDGNEDPLETARRELAEELGLVAAKWTDLGMVDPFTAIAFSPTRLFLAEELKETNTSPELTEVIQHIVIPFKQVLKMVLESEIAHAPSCTAILKSWLIKSIEFKD